MKSHFLVFNNKYNVCRINILAGMKIIRVIQSKAGTAIQSMRKMKMVIY